MRRIIALLSVMAMMAAMVAASTVPVFAEAHGQTIPCSDLYGPEVTGVIVFAPDGTPSLFTCQGGPFGQGQGGGATVIPCSDLYGPEVTGVIVFTPGGTPSNFACQGGPFPRGG
jgi:hypothetical protein